MTTMDRRPLEPGTVHAERIWFEKDIREAVERVRLGGGAWDGALDALLAELGLEQKP
jgi:hypothetical protein